MRIKHHKISVRYDLQLLMLIYKYVYVTPKIGRSVGVELRGPVPGGRVMRSTGTCLLKYPDSNLLGYRKSPLYRGIELWNSLTPECRTTDSKELFRSRVKEFLQLQFKEKLRSKGLLY